MLGQGGESNPLPTFIFMGAIFLVMYFFMIRPQTKKAKEQRQFLESVQKGDKVVTAGGIHGRIAQVEENTFLLEVDKNTKMRIEKNVLSNDYTQELRKRQQNNKEQKNKDKSQQDQGKDNEAQGETKEQNA